jgi:hypothetical protein
MSPRRSSDWCRLRKYARKKRNSDPWMRTLYWRYWHRIYGRHD